MLTIDLDEKDEHYVFYCNRWIRETDTAVEFIPGNLNAFVEYAKA